MNERRHTVLLGSHRIGTLAHTGDVARFTFAPEYWEDPDRHVLGLWFENNPGSSPSAKIRLPVWFSNLLPEGRLREWIATDRGVSAARETELLLQVGHDLPGAIQVIEDGDREIKGAPLYETEEIHPLADADSPREWKFSLAGVGLKFSMLRAGDRLTMPAANLVGDWIVKLPDATYRDVPRNEFAMMTLAGRIGIDVPECQLVEREDLPDLPDAAWPGVETYAYAVSRFDRSASGGRIHIEDFAQVRGFYSEFKYHGTFETVGALVYRGKDLHGLREFARRLTFNLLIGNGDAHLKNWSMIYRDGRTAELSPAYDLVSTAPYMLGEIEDLGLKFGGTRRLHRPTWKDFLRLEQRLGASGADLPAVVEETVRLFEKEWADMHLEHVGLSNVSNWISSHFESTKQRLFN